MSDIPSLKSKINDLKAKVEQDSISPSYLGALLDDIIDTLDTKNNSPASSSADGKMSAADKRRLDATEGIVAFDDMVDGVHLNTGSPSVPAGDEVDNRQSTAPDGCELVYSSSDGRFYARKAKAGGGYTWFLYPKNRDIWGEPNPEVAGKGILARAGYAFLCRNINSAYNGEVYTARYVDYASGKKATKLFRLTSVSEFNKAVADLLTRNGVPRVRINRGNLDVFVDQENCRLTFAGEGFGVSVDGTDGGFVWLANEPRTACTRFAFDNTDSTKFLAVDLQGEYPAGADGFRRGSLTQLVKGITLNQLRTGRYLPVAYVYRASEHGSHIALLGEFADIYGNPTTEREIRRTAFADVESAYMQGNARRFAPATGSTAWFGRLRLLHVSDVHEHWAELQEALEVGQEFADIVVDTGDMLSTDAPDKLASYGAAIANSLRPVIAARGNHDARVSKSNGTLQGPTAAQWFADVHSKMPSGFVQPATAVAAKRCYGYRDITPNATAGTFRIIMLDPQDCAEPSLWCYAYFSPEQVQWLISTLTDAMSKGYHVITMMHYSFGEADSPEWSEVHDGGPARADATFLQGAGMIPDIIDAMQHGTALSRTYASSKSGYAAVTVNIAARTDSKRLDYVAHLFGHIHAKTWHWCECAGKEYDMLMLGENALALDGVALNVSPHLKGRPNALSCSVLNIDPVEKAIYRVSYGSYIGFDGMTRERVTRLPYRRSAGADATTPATLGDLAALPEATPEKAGMMPAVAKRRLDGTECVVSIDDVVSHINLNTSNFVLPSTDDVDDRQSTAPDGCELVYSTQDGRLYARQLMDNGGYMWYYYPQGRDLWGEPDPEVNGKGILPRAGYLFVCNNPASEYNGKLFVGRYIVRADGRKGTQLVRLPFASEIPTPQSKRTATVDDKMYVYSVNNPNSKQSVLNAPDTLLRQANGKLKFQKGIWNPDGGSVYYTVNEIPCATASADGAMAKDVLNRLGAAATEDDTDTTRIYERQGTSTEVVISYPNWATGGARAFKLNRATSARAGVMSSSDKIKLDALTPIIYGRSNSTKRAINSALFALEANATDAEIKAALTEYATKAVLNRQELEQCAASGCTLWDEQTQAQVHVTHNGGGYFNFVELSQVHYGELPHLRFVGLRAMEDGTYKVTRPGMTERIAFQSELQTLIDRIEALESIINTQG